MLQYVRSFASSIKENLKSLTQWSIHYFTSKDNWYPLPEKSRNFKIPERLPPAKVTAENKKNNARVDICKWENSKKKNCAPRNNYGKKLVLRQSPLIIRN